MYKTFSLIPGLNLRVYGLALFIALALAGNSFADEAAIRSRVSNLFKTIPIQSVEKSPIAGLYEVMVGPRIFYTSEDGRFFIQGSMIDLETRQDLTEIKVASARVKSIKDVGYDQMIRFGPDMSKHEVFVFTDIDCGYCRKLHSQVNDYIKKGIAINYLFYPRAGIGSESYDKAVSVWCADDRQDALTKSKNGMNLGKQTCENPVKKHYELGQLLEARGTPLIVTQTGEKIPGYVSPDKLLTILEDTSTAKQAAMKSAKADN
ncbi:MAG TPA: DsbC family protein [Crenotrichaceae bacterium]|nr:DsbC family protein [Crenotrichaceae bacterium]